MWGRISRLWILVFNIYLQMSENIKAMLKLLYIYVIHFYGKTYKLELKTFNNMTSQNADMRIVGGMGGMPPEYRAGIWWEP